MPLVTLDDCDIHYRVDGRGEPLLLVHGLGGSCADWRYQIDAFAARYRVIRMCLRGFGHSSRPAGPYSIAGHTRDVRALVAQLGLGRVHVLGHSMGGAIGFQLAVDAPGELRSLIVLNSQPSFIIDSWRKRLMLSSRLLMVRMLGMRKFARRMLARTLPDPAHAERRAWLLERHALNDASVYSANLRALTQWSIVSQLSTLKLPVLMITAQNDLSPVEEKRAFAAQLPDARFEVIPRSGHMTQIDQSERFNALVLEFLEKGVRFIFREK